MITIEGKVTGVQRRNNKKGEPYYEYSITNTVTNDVGMFDKTIIVKSKQNGIEYGQDVRCLDCYLNPWVGRNNTAYVAIWCNAIEVL